MDLVGRKVEHPTYKEGVITKQSSSMIWVQFPGEEKRFPYPAGFKEHLKVLEMDVAAEIKKEIKKHDEEQAHKKAEQSWEATPVYRQTQKKEPKGAHGKTVEVRPFGSVESFCDEYKRAIATEVTYLRGNGGKHQKVFDGKRVETKRGHFVYSFESDTELKYPEGTQITIWKEVGSCYGHIIGCEDFVVLLASKENLGEEVPSLEFSAEPWRLLDTLTKRLERIQQQPSEIVQALICDGYQAIEPEGHPIAAGQENAIQMSQKQPITFVWGPPGTGKTQTLARIALAHMRQGHRVLMLSYSNVSVDGAILRVHQLAPDKKPGALVRYGYAQQKELLQHEYLTAYNLTIRKHPELQKERQALSAERKKWGRSTQRYTEIGRRLTGIKKELEKEEKETVKTAGFVATTVSKAVVDRVIYQESFDVVIFDEASMAYIPQIIFSASLAQKHFICLGDFRQLPPIVQSSDKSLLNADIFQYCGISAAVDSGRSHKWLCMLDTQYRMHQHIADFVSRTMYHGLLTSAEEVKKPRGKVVRSRPAAEHAMALADLSGMMNVCMKVGDHSRVNVLSAIASFVLALEAAKRWEVGVITPYHAQSRLLHAMARDAAERNPALKPISCATVHQFQGSEKDVIVYDAVDCYRMKYPGRLLTENKNNYANRLFNVALTRAKGKFVGVVNAAYMENKHLSKNLMFRQMMDSQSEKTSCLTGEALLKEFAAVDEAGVKFFRCDHGQTEFLNDLAKAQKEINLDIPDKPVGDTLSKQLAGALQAAKKKGITVSVRAENKASLPYDLRPLAIENRAAVNPVALIDRKTVWFGMPHSDANFQSEGSVLLTRYRPIFRLEGKYTATALYGFLEMNKTEDQSKTVTTDEAGNAITERFGDYVLANKTCPSCGKPMRLRKGKKGAFFLACTGYPGCKETAYIEEDLVERYIHRHGGTGQHCTKCDCSLEAKSGRHGVYVQCCGLQQHKYKFDEI